MKITFLAIGLSLAIAATANAQDVASANGTPDHRAYLDFQVERPVRVKSRAVPVYPEGLRAARVEGEVLVQFNVDERGTAQMHTFKVVKASNTAFVEPVRRAVSSMSFHPAEAHGKKVTQLVQQEFKFASSR